MRYLEAPEIISEYDPSFVRIFLAGGVTDCPNWQSTAALFFADYYNVTVMNPRRLKFDTADENAAAQQIHWEYTHLKMADAILFWFCDEAIQAISLLELGRWSQQGETKPIFVGCHRGYPRKDDVIMQLALSRPEVLVVPTLRAVCQQVEEWMVGEHNITREEEGS